MKKATGPLTARQKFRIGDRVFHGSTLGTVKGFAHKRRFSVKVQADGEKVITFWAAAYWTKYTEPEDMPVVDYSAAVTPDNAADATAASDFKSLQFTGITSSFPAIKRYNGVELEVCSADAQAVSSNYTYTTIYNPYDEEDNPVEIGSMPPPSAMSPPCTHYAHNAPTSLTRWERLQLWIDGRILWFKGIW